MTTGTGKSSLLLRYDENIFSPTFISTIGIDFRVKYLTIDCKTVKLQVWDTGGQERFKTITTAYYRGAMGIIVVYDVTDAVSFDHVYNWLSDIEKYACAGVDKILVANKCDLIDKRVISTDRGQALANKYGIPFYEVSAKSSLNVDKVFLTLATDCHNRLFNGAVPTITELEGRPSNTNIFPAQSIGAPTCKC